MVTNGTRLERRAASGALALAAAALVLAACGPAEDSPPPGDAEVQPPAALAPDSAAPGTTQGTAQDTAGSVTPEGTAQGLDGLAAEAADARQEDAAAGDSTDALLQAVQELRLEVAELRGAQSVAQEPAPQDTTTRAREVPGQLIRQAREGVGSLGVRLVLSLLVLAAAGLLIRLSTFVLDALAEQTATRRLFMKRLVPIVRLSLWALTIYVVVAVVLGVNAQGLLAASAALGVAVGFAAQDILKNIFGGLIVIFDQPFQVGDKISVEGTYGEVVSIGLRSTKLVTPDDNLVTVPNAQIVEGQVANANAGELNCQVVTELYLPGWVDEAQARDLAYQAAISSEYVYLKKPVVVLVKDVFKETFLLQVKVKAYVLDPRHEFLFQSDVTERARSAFRDAGLLPEGIPLHGFVHRPADATPSPSGDGGGT